MHSNQNTTLPQVTAWDWLASALAAVPCFYLCIKLFAVWADPLAHSGGDWLRFGIGLMLMEFILLHSGVFMAAVLAIQSSRSKQVAAWFGLALFYGLMVWGFSVALDSPALLWIFVSIVVGRSLPSFLQREQGVGAGMARSAMGAPIYILIVFASVFIPVPEWGITPAVIEQVYPDRGGGLWEDEPQRAIAGAAVYFGLMGLAEWFLLGPFLRSRSARQLA